MEYIFFEVKQPKKIYFKVFIFLLLVVGNSYADTLLVANKKEIHTRYEFIEQVPGLKYVQK